MINKNVKHAYAPILIHTYTRLDHLRKTITALVDNYYADQTDLIVASDFPKTDDDVNKVAEVRKYLNSIHGFKSVRIILRSKNFGPHLNIEYAIDEVFEKYDSLIAMEDDIVTGKGFIDFMNNGLYAYKNDDSVLAISGYMWKNATFKNNPSSILLNGFAPWGWASWKEKYYSVKRDTSLSKVFIRNPLLFLRMMYVNPGLIGMVDKIASGKLYAGDVNWNLHIIKYNKLVLFPAMSLTRNIGWDGSGYNCTVDESFMNQFYSNERVKFQLVTQEMINDNKRVVFNVFGGYRAFFLNIIILLLHKYLPHRILIYMKKLRNFLFIRGT